MLQWVKKRSKKNPQPVFELSACVCDNVQQINHKTTSVSLVYIFSPLHLLHRRIRWLAVLPLKIIACDNIPLFSSPPAVPAVCLSVCERLCLCLTKPLPCCCTGVAVSRKSESSNCVQKVSNVRVCVGMSRGAVRLFSSSLFSPVNVQSVSCTLSPEAFHLTTKFLSLTLTFPSCSCSLIHRSSSDLLTVQDGLLGPDGCDGHGEEKDK